MKIALVVHDFLQGIGHGRYCIELARRFAGEHEVHVLANRFEDGLNFKYQPRPVRAWRQTAITSVLTFPRGADEILEVERFDIVHAQGFACARANVITAHVCNAARYRRNPPETLRQKLFPKAVIPRERAFYQANSSAEVIAVSKVLAGELRQEYGVQQAEVIYHGVDCSQFRPGPKLTRAWTWLFAGEATKGLNECIRALTDFPEARLVVVSRSKLDAHIRLAKDCRVSARVDFRGQVSDMPTAYQSADVFLYPSRYDTFGMVVAEAMACGLPVIAGRDIGAAEWIEDGKNGFLCDPDDPKSIVENLRAAERAEVSENARMTAKAHSWDDCAARTFEVYQRAISTSRTKK